MASKWLKARQTKYAAYATTYILVVLAVVVIANFLGKRYNKSYDATANKRYSLSSETEEDCRRPAPGRDHHLLQPDHALQPGPRPAR